MKNFIFVSIFLLTLQIPSITHANLGILANTWNLNQPTIKEMQENLAELKEEKNIIDDKWSVLNKINGKVADYLRNDLTTQQVTEITTLASIYSSQKESYESQLKFLSENWENLKLDELKVSFVQTKLTFYKNLVPYIDVSKKDAYLTYIKWSVEIEKENKDIKEKIYKQEEVIEERVDDLKEKIKVHNEVLEQKLRVLIYSTIDKKISAILNQEKVTRLSTENKKKILWMVLKKLSEEKEALSQLNDITERTQKKIAIYEIAENVIQKKQDEL